MTGGGPHTVRPIRPDPSPSAVPTEEAIAAKDKTKARAGRSGRGQNILAGRLMQGRQVLSTGKRELGA